MKRFNKKRITQATSNNIKDTDIQITTLDCVRDKFDCSRPFMYLDMTGSEAGMTIVRVGKDIPIPTVINTYGGAQEWCRLLQCKHIRINEITIDGKYYTVIYDKEDLNNEPLFVSGIGSDGTPVLTGNLLICNSGELGEETSLLKDDVSTIVNHTIDVGSTWENKNYCWTALEGIGS